MSISEPRTVNCGRELRELIRQKDVVDSLTELLFYAVYDEKEKRCRNLSPLDRLATSISKYSAKIALYDIKRGLTPELTAIGEEVKKSLDSLNIIEMCLDISELESIEILKTLALKTLGKCLKSLATEKKVEEGEKRR